MKNFFEYFYYRFAQRHFKREGADAFTALINVTFVQFWWIFNIFIFIKYSLVNSEVRKLYLYEKIAIAALLLALYFINRRLYSKRYMEFRERWKNESKIVRQRNWILLISLIIFSWFLILLNGWIFNRINI